MLMERLAAAAVVCLILAVPAATMSVKTVIMDSLAAAVVAGMGGLILAVPAATMEEFKY